MITLSREVGVVTDVFYLRSPLFLNIFFIIGKLPEAEARYFFQQIISAVSYCHSMHVVHRGTYRMIYESQTLSLSLNYVQI